MRIKFPDLPTDNVAQWVEHRLDMPWAWVRIIASVRFFIRSVKFFHYYPDEAPEGPISTAVSQKHSTMLIQKTSDKYTKLHCIYIYCHGSAFTILRTLFSMNSLVLATMYIYTAYYSFIWISVCRY